MEREWKWRWGGGVRGGAWKRESERGGLVEERQRAVGRKRDTCNTAGKDIESVKYSMEIEIYLLQMGMLKDIINPMGCNSPVDMTACPRGV